MEAEQLIADIRQFNRFYTLQLGLLQQHVFDSEYSLTDIRVLYEIHFAGRTTATGIREALKMDAGYLSRILRSFEKQGLLIKHPLPEDGRSFYLQLTARGRKVVTHMNELSDHQIQEMLKGLDDAQQEQIAGAMGTVRRLLKAPDSTPRLEDIVIRHELRPGDIGDIIKLHGVLYAKEFAYNIDFEKYVVSTFHEFLPAYDPARDRLWLATWHGELVGLVAIIHRGKAKAQLRWFLIHPSFRGIGLGKELMDKAMAYCRKKAFREVYLLTTHQQDVAAKLYTRAGFVKTGTEPQQMWGHDLYEERYELKLRQR